MVLANLDYVDVRDVKLEFTEAFVDGDLVGRSDWQKAVVTPSILTVGPIYLPIVAAGIEVVALVAWGHSYS